MKKISSAKMPFPKRCLSLSGMIRTLPTRITHTPLPNGVPFLLEGRKSLLRFFKGPLVLPLSKKIRQVGNLPPLFRPSLLFSPFKMNPFSQKNKISI